LPLACSWEESLLRWSKKLNLGKNDSVRIGLRDLLSFFHITRDKFGIGASSIKRQGRSEEDMDSDPKKEQY